ncbi:MAG: tyrosine-protein phosphatase [Bacilli bacterium]
MKSKTELNSINSKRPTTSKREGNIDNFRDLGSLRTTSSETRPGFYFRSKKLSSPDLQFIKLLSDNKIKTVLDLRTEKETEENPDDLVLFNNLEITYRQIGIKDLIHFSTLACLKGELFTSYRDILENHREEIGQIFEILNDSEKPLLIHCNGGKDRTGVIVMLLLKACGVVDEEIENDYVISDYSNQLQIKENPHVFRFDPDSFVVHAYIEDAKKVLDYIKAEGGIEKYLFSCGVSLNLIEDIKTKFVF